MERHSSDISEVLIDHPTLPGRGVDNMYGANRIDDGDHSVVTVYLEALGHLGTILGDLGGELSW